MNDIKNDKIAVIGGGAWGCAIANVLSDNHQSVTVFTSDIEFTDSINSKNETPRLPSIKLSTKIKAITQIDKDIVNFTCLFIVVPSQVVSEVLNKVSNYIEKSTVIVMCSKGIDDLECKLFSDSIENILPNNEYAILSGPNFAGEVANKLPSITTVASNNHITADKVCDIIKTDYFVPIISNDIISTQIFGAIKNILAIGCGIIEGLGLDMNSKSALVVKGVYEMNLLISKLGGVANNFFSPAGLGDLFLTCSSSKSRNNSLGILIGKGNNPKEALDNKDVVYEGSKSVQSIMALSKANGVNLPLCKAIYDILYINHKNVRSIILNAILNWE